MRLRFCRGLSGAGAGWAGGTGRPPPQTGGRGPNGGRSLRRNLRANPHWGLPGASGGGACLSVSTGCRAHDSVPHPTRIRQGRSFQNITSKMRAPLENTPVELFHSHRCASAHTECGRPGPTSVRTGSGPASCPRLRPRPICRRTGWWGCGLTPPQEQPFVLSRATPPAGRPCPRPAPRRAPSHLDPGAGQVHVGLPLGLHLPVLRGLGVHELLAVGRVQLPGDRALEGLGGAGAVQGVRPADQGVPAERGRRSEDTPEPRAGRADATRGGERTHGKLPSRATRRGVGCVGQTQPGTAGLVSGRQIKHENH